MSLSRIFLLAFMLSLSLTPVFGQGGAVIIYSIPDFGAPAVGCGCDNPVPFGNGHSYCIYWDNNQNGPDPEDQIIEVGESYGQGNFACATFGGPWGDGYFETDPPFYVNNLPLPSEGDHPVYYIKAGGDNCCWTTQSFTLAAGFATLGFTDTSWTCSTSPCEAAAVPPPPTNVVASDDERCMQIEVTWEHTGVDLTGFNIYVNDVFAVNLPSTDRSRVLTIDTQDQKTIRVNAVNQQQESAPAQDTGSMYLRRFVDGPEGDLSGNFQAGSGFNINFTRPEVGECGAYLRLTLLVNNQVHSVLCEENTDPYVLEMDCNLPSSQTPLSNCRLLLTTIPTIRPDLSYTDTTESTFNVGAVDASEHPDLLADRFSISQNYPNPFNSSTEIQFNLPIMSIVRIDVFNIYGQNVTTLVNDVKSAGTHVTTWNGTASSGATMSSGVYLYRMVAGNYRAAGKMMLLR